MNTTNWILDAAHSELGFKIKHLMISNVSGAIQEFEAKVETEGNDFTTAKIELKGNMRSISTNNTQRDAHLRNSDFFEVEKFPDLIFTSAKVEKADSDNFTIFGDLTMKGVTKPVKLNAEFNGMAKDSYGQEKAGFYITGKIKRSDWGINFNGVLESGGVMLGEDVKIFSEIQFVKQEATVTA